MASREIPVWEAVLRPWHRVSAMIALVELPVIVAALSFVFVFDPSYRIWAYLAAGAVVGLELVKWVIDREDLHLASASAVGLGGNGESLGPSVSGDGTLVAFFSPLITPMHVDAMMRICRRSAPR